MYQVRRKKRWTRKQDMTGSARALVLLTRTQTPQEWSVQLWGVDWKPWKGGTRCCTESCVSSHKLVKAVVFCLIFMAVEVAGGISCQQPCNSYWCCSFTFRHCRFCYISFGNLGCRLGIYHKPELWFLLAWESQPTCPHSTCLAAYRYPHRQSNPLELRCSLKLRKYVCFHMGHTHGSYPSIRLADDDDDDAEAHGSHDLA